MGDGPARRARDEAEAFLQIEPVHLVDDAVDVIGELSALLGQLLVVGEQLGGAGAHARLWVDRQAPLGERGVNARLSVGRQLGNLAPGIGKEAQRPRRRNRGIELAQRAGRGIARIGEHLASARLLLLVETPEVGMCHVDLAAHVDQLGDVAALQLVRDRGDGHHVLGDVLAFHAVAACRRLGERAILVAQRDRQPVDFRLGGEGERRIGVELQKAVHALNEVRHVLGVEGITQRQHRHAVLDLAEAFGRAPRRRVSRDCRGARAWGSVPRSPRCAGAMHRTRRRRSPARPGGR